MIVIQHTSRKKIFEYWLPAIAWMAVIFSMSTDTFSARNTSLIIGPLLLFFFPGLTSGEIELIHGLLRKFGHFSEYLIFAFLLFRALRGASPGSLKAKPFLPTFLFTSLYAASDEIHQLYVSSRTASARDVCIDVLGGLFGLGLAALRYRKDRNGRG